jgi:hypothetical protein
VFLRSGYTDLMISAKISGLLRSLKRKENSFKYKGESALLGIEIAREPLLIRETVDVESTGREKSLLVKAFFRLCAGIVRVGAP